MQWRPPILKYTRSQYTVGILCPLPKELMAVRALFDSRHDNLETVPGDSNQYALGKMAQHMVVAACLPAGEYGTNAAAAAACNMVRSFDQPVGTCPGVLQYDLGKEEEGKSLKLTGTLQRPPRILTTAIAALQSDPDLGPEPLAPNLRKVAGRMPRYSYPGNELDVLFQVACATCRPRNLSGGCSHMRQRMPRPTTDPTIHYGPVASGNRVVKDATFRDQCFEMEAAGVTNAVDCLVIRGISDYCDANKNDTWQEYVAAAAAAYAKLLLGVVAKADDKGSHGSIRRSFTERPTWLRSMYDEREGEQARKRRKV
ncbi:nucleoside phosphorylase domain-containing protein [Thelonectria olida]|uniref:Nucleoside phosphorylase domain-containing protein n=1 Tax=Thelonectria olida TaxID=1576542 RepID=A0A9P8VYI7_9HYPO|nr:nucleoside phosphorylase domain-containing protein [Thelonectria olida]